MPPVLQQTVSASVGRRREPLVIQIEQQVGICVIRISGHFSTGAYSDYALLKMEEIMRLGCAKIVADFAGVMSIGSEAVSFLVGLYRFSEGRLVLVNPQRRVSEVLGITRLNRIITVVSDVDSGLALLENGQPVTAQPYNEP